jgi:uncharacterized protein (DUF849 family)
MDLIINFTPTGMIPTKEMTPHVPISPEEIIEDVRRAVDIGITMVHLHAREAATGNSTYKAEVFGQIIAGIRSFSEDLIICISLSGRRKTCRAVATGWQPETGYGKPDAQLPEF